LAEVQIEEALVGWAASQTRDEIFHTAQLWRLPVVPVLTPDEVLNDEQCRARGVWTQKSGGPPVAASPFRFSVSERLADKGGPAPSALTGQGRGGGARSQPMHVHRSEEQQLGALSPPPPPPPPRGGGRGGV